MKAVLDACVLYPTLTRALLLDAAAAGLFTPVWSPRIIGEWTHTARREGDAAMIAGEVALLAARWPAAEVAVPADIETALDLPDPDDTHVLAAAIAATADALVTFNLRDFPARALARHGVTPWHPDALLAMFLSDDADRLAPAIRDRTAPLAPHGLTPRAALKKARLPRTGKAAERLGL